MSAGVNPSVLDTIGRTPVVRVSRIVAPGARVFAKLEGWNPAGSVKDRIARTMIEEAEGTGALEPGMTLVEPTSGNTGIGLAMVAAARGYKLEVVMPDTMSIERRDIVTALGAEVVLTPGDQGMNGAICEAQARSEKPGYYMPNQFANPANVKAHYEGTGREIIEQVGEVDVFVAGLGTSGTLMGVGKRLREANPAVKVVAVEPYPGSQIQGLKCLQEGYIPPIFDPDVLTEKVLVEDEEAFATARELMRVEGLSVGISAGAAMVEARRQAAKLGDGTVVVLFADRSDRYLSTRLFQDG